MWSSRPSRKSSMPSWSRCQGTYCVKQDTKLALDLGSGWGAVDRGVTSNTRGPHFESSHWRTFISNICLPFVNSIEKTINKKILELAHWKIISIIKVVYLNGPFSDFCAKSGWSFLLYSSWNSFRWPMLLSLPVASSLVRYYLGY